MKLNRLAYNVVGLIVAGFYSLAALSTLFIILPGATLKSHGFWHLMAAVEAFAGITIGGGAVANLSEGRRLAAWPTGIMITGYVATIWGLPLAVWGIVSLVMEQRHRKQELAQAQLSGV